jgi:hypothetical protein
MTINLRWPWPPFVRHQRRRRIFAKGVVAHGFGSFDTIDEGTAADDFTNSIDEGVASDNFTDSVDEGRAADA